MPFLSEMACPYQSSTSYQQSFHKNSGILYLAIDLEDARQNIDRYRYFQRPGRMTR